MTFKKIQISSHIIFFLKWLTIFFTTCLIVAWRYILAMDKYPDFRAFLGNNYPQLAGDAVVLIVIIYFTFSLIEYFLKDEDTLASQLKKLNLLLIDLQQQQSTEKIYSLALYQLQKQLNYETAHIFLVDDNKKYLSRKYSSDKKSNKIGIKISLEDESSFLPKVYKNKKSILIKDFFKYSSTRWAQMPETLKQFYQKFWKEYGVKSLIAVPLITEIDRNQTIGVIIVSSRTLNLTRNDLIILETYSYQLAAALLKASFYEKEKRVNLDLSEKIEDAVKEIKNHQVLLSNVINSVKDGILTVDNQLNVILTNNNLKKILDIDIKIGININEVTADKELFSLLKKIPSSGKKKLKSSTDEKIIEWLWLPLYIDEINTNGWILVIRDITHSENLEKKIRLNDTLSTLGQMAASIVHEIKNPLSAMELYLNLMKKKIEKTATGYKYIDKIQYGITNINNLAVSLLGYTKASSEEIELLEVETLLKVAFESSIPKTGLDKYKTNFIFSKEKTYIYANSSQIIRLFINIIKNAFESMPGGGEIYIRTKKGDEITIIEIEDTGNGMTEAEKSKLFETYFTTKKSGTGLGMAICKQIVEVNKGSITIESEKNKGTRVIMKFPFKEKEKEVRQV